MMVAPRNRQVSHVQVLEHSQEKLEAIVGLQRHTSTAIEELSKLLQGAEQAPQLPGKLQQLAKEHAKQFTPLWEIARVATGDPPVAVQHLPSLLSTVARKLHVDLPQGKSVERFSEEQVQERVAAAVQKAGVVSFFVRITDNSTYQGRVSG
jgi:hypothetical protein